MTLEEAIDALENEISCRKNTEYENDYTTEVLSYVLNYIENDSIPKEKVKECIEDIIDYFEHVSVPYEDMEFLEEWKKKILGG